MTAPTTTQTELPPSNDAPIPVPVEPPPGFWVREATHHPQPLSPANRSLMLDVMNRSWHSLFTEFGLLLENIEMREIGGWVYQRVVPLGGKDRPAPPAPVMKVLTWLPPLRGRIRTCQQALRDGKAWLWIDLWEQEWRPSIIAENAALRAVDLVDLTDEEFQAHLKRTRAQVEHALDIHTRVAVPNGLGVSNLVISCKEILGWDDRQSLRLLSGLSEMSSAPARQLAKVASLASQRAPVRDYLLNTVSPTLEGVRSVDAEIGAAVDGYLHDFGCRALRYDVIEPALEESPDLVVQWIADQLATGYDPIARAEELAAERAAAVAEARAALASRPADLERFEEALKYGQRAYPLREENEFYTVSVPVALLRYALLEAGSRMTLRDQLAAAEDVMQLEWDEITTALTSGEPQQALVDRRYRERAWVLENPGPESFGPPPPPPPSMSAFPEDVRRIHEQLEWEIDRNFPTPVTNRSELVLNGIPASDGSYTGPARIVLDESQFHRIQPGDVLVCPITSPVWSVLFASIGALITESGGILSHPAIIAREYRIPAVVAVSNVTSTLKDGQVITVDGSTGEIHIHAS